MDELKSELFPLEEVYMSNEPLLPPKADPGDHVHTLARAGISSLPYVGGAAVELFQMLVTPPLERRRLEWMKSVGEGLNKLEEKYGNIIDDLKSNEQFIDTTMQASQAAIRTSQREKKDALRNAVLNAALLHAPDESRQQMFVGWVDSYTPWHLRMLRLFANPRSWYQDNGRQPPQYHLSSTLSGLLTDAYPDLKSERPFYDKVAKDLYNDDLIKSDDLHVMMSASGAFEMRATPLGEEFLRFICDPLK